MRGSNMSSLDSQLAPLYAAAESAGYKPLLEQMLQQQGPIGSSGYSSLYGAGHTELGTSNVLGSSTQGLYSQYPTFTQETISTSQGDFTYAVLSGQPSSRYLGDLSSTSSYADMMGYASAEMSAGVRGGLDRSPAGMIFGCKESTKGECLRRQVFGLPALNMDMVAKIVPGTKLFLFNFDTKQMYGIFEAVSPGGVNLDPGAFGGAFPAQVRFAWSEDCPPLTEDLFGEAIKENYYKKGKFKFDLNSIQVLLRSFYCPDAVIINC